MEVGQDFVTTWNLRSFVIKYGVTELCDKVKLFISIQP